MMKGEKGKGEGGGEREKVKKKKKKKGVKKKGENWGESAKWIVCRSEVGQEI
jgi:hypothetical protein